MHTEAATGTYGKSTRPPPGKDSLIVIDKLDRLTPNGCLDKQHLKTRHPATKLPLQGIIIYPDLPDPPVDQRLA